MDTQLYLQNQRPAVSLSYDIPHGAVVIHGNRIPDERQTKIHAPATDRSERRSAPRYAVTRTAVALVESNAEKFRNICKMSMAEIACAVFKSNPASIGEITDISIHGLAFQYIEKPDRPNHFTQLDILLAEGDFYLKDIQVEVISDVAVREDFGMGSFETRRAGVRFLGLAADQKALLRNFIRNFTSRVPLTH